MGCCPRLQSTSSVATCWGRGLCSRVPGESRQLSFRAVAWCSLPYSSRDNVPGPRHHATFSLEKGRNRTLGAPRRGRFGRWFSAVQGPLRPSRCRWSEARTNTPRRGCHEGQTDGSSGEKNSEAHVLCHSTACQPLAPRVTCMSITHCAGPGLLGPHHRPRSPAMVPLRR